MALIPNPPQSNPYTAHIHMFCAFSTLLIDKTLRKPDRALDGVGRSLGDVSSEQTENLQRSGDDWVTPRRVRRNRDTAREADGRGKPQAFLGANKDLAGRYATKKQRPRQRKRKRDALLSWKLLTTLPPHYSIYGRFGVLLETEEPNRGNKKKRRNPARPIAKRGRTYNPRRRE